MRWLLDTSAMSGPAPHRLQGEPAISSASLAELPFGVPVAQSDEVRSQRLGRVAVVERTFEACRSTARWHASTEGSPRRLPQQVGKRARVMDLLIAATAAAQGARLVTRDARGLRALEDRVEVVDLG